MNHKGRPNWLPHETAILKLLFSFTETDDLAEMLGRPYCSIHNKARQIGLYKSRAFMRCIRSEIATRNYGNGRPNMQGKKHPFWKGGFISQGQFRYHFTYMPTHPNAVHGGKYIMTHRLVMERKIGRLLTRKEVVHHINHNTLDNRPGNLQLLADNAAHRKAHIKENVRFTKACENCGGSYQAFYAQRSLYCSNRCRNQTFHLRRRSQLIAR